MKPVRLALALIGLAMLALAYATGNLYFLVVAIVAFFAGLYLMGGGRKPAPADTASNRKKQSD